MKSPSEEWIRHWDAIVGDLDCTIGRPKPPRDVQPTSPAKSVPIPAELLAKFFADAPLPRNVWLFAPEASYSHAELEAWLRKATEKIVSLGDDSPASQWIIEVLDNGADVAVYRRAA